MRFSILISLFAIAQARHLYSEIAPGEFIQPADGLKNLEYHTQQNVNVSYRLNDGFSTSDFGIARDVDGTTEFTTYCTLIDCLWNGLAGYELIGVSLI